jgi:ribosome-associated translation inhibitor RaiA
MTSRDSNDELWQQRIDKLESQLRQYRDRVNYHKSLEEEHKKNLESQVDVLLKMEEERLQLVREHQQATTKFDEVQKELEAAREENAEIKKQRSQMEKLVSEIKD